MARTLNDAPYEMFVGLEVTHKQKYGQPDKITWRWVGPYSTVAATKGQMKEEDWRDLYEDPWYQRGPVVGRVRTDRVVLRTEMDWKPV